MNTTQRVVLIINLILFTVAMVVYAITPHCGHR